MRKPAGAIISLRLTWIGPHPPIVGDWLYTASGRQYEVEEIHGKRHVCRVLPIELDEPGEGFRRLLFHWDKR